MSLTLKVATNEDMDLWDDIVNRSPHGTIFHHWKFLKIMEKHSSISFLGRSYPGKLLAFIGFDLEKPVCICPIFFYDLPFMKTAYSPPLRTEVTYQGPVYADYDNLKCSKKEEYAVEFQKSMDSYLEKLHVKITRIKTPPNNTDARAYTWNGYDVSPCYNYELDLKAGINSLWENCGKDLRKNVKKTSEKGVTVREGGREDLKYIFEAFISRYKMQAVPTEVAYEYVLDLYDCFYPDHLRFFMSEKDGKFLSGQLMLMHKGKTLTWIGTAKNSIEGVSPNDLLLWEIIRWSVENGYSTLELTWANTRRLCKYKSKFNPRAVPYFSCEKCSPLISAFLKLKQKHN